MPGALVYVARDELVVLDAAGLAQTFAAGRRHWRTGAVVVRGADGYRLFDQAEWRSLLLSARLEHEPARTARELLHERRPAELVARADVVPERPCVVVVSGEVVGAWVPAPFVAPPAPYPSRRRGLGRILRGGPRAEPPPGDDWAPAPPERPRVDDGVAVDEASPPGAAGARTLRRTPHLDVPDALPIAAGATFTVVVRTDVTAALPDEAASDVVVELPPGVDELTVGVLLSVSDHFAVTGSPFGFLTLRAEVAESDPLAFELSLTGAEAGGQAGVVASFSFQGRPCGSVRRAWTWAPDQQTPALVAPPGGPNDPVVAVHPEDVRPDLTVIVTAPVNDGVNFSCSVSTPLLPAYDTPTPSEPFALPARADEFVTKRLERLSDETLTPEDRRVELDAAGVEFWRVAPPVFKRVLGALIDAGTPPGNIFIASVEPTLPWELMIPSFPDAQGLPVDRPPLGVEFRVGRWVQETMVAPPQNLPVESALIVAPTYAGSRALDAAAETELLVQRLRGERVTPATRAELEARLASTSASLLHFVCHGVSGVADDDAIYLDDDAELRAGVARVLPGFKAACRRQRPLVFLNSCETGRLVRGLAGAAGFPLAFTELGARGVIAPLWPVDDACASRVAELFYTRALDDPAMPLAEIVRAVRALAYEEEPFDDSLAAYCYFGDPLTTLAG